MPQIIQRMTFSRRAVFMPLNLAICAAVVPEGWDVEIIDENVTDSAHLASPDGIDAVGIGAMTTQAKRAYSLADDYRRLGVPVILGGIHPSVLPEEALMHASIVCKGDAESTLPHALRDLDAGRAKELYDWRDNPDAPIATPRKDLLNPKDYLVFNPIQTTRGCPHRCTFCTTPVVFGQKFRQRDIGSIVEEIREARDTFNTRVFIFSDDNVAGNQKWAMELFDAIRPLKIKWASQCDILIAHNERLLKAMRGSGCQGLILGLESPKAGTLAEVHKKHAHAEEYTSQIAKIHSAGISIWGSFIFGFDNDNWQDCLNTVRFAQRTRLCMSIYTILTPYPGTRLFDQYRAEGRLLTTDWDKYNGANVVFRPRQTTAEELQYAQQAAFCEFYSFRSIFQRLGIYPLKRNSWLANLAIYRGLHYYYGKRKRLLPRFADRMVKPP